MSGDKNRYIGGIEGGGTHSHLVICDGDSKTVARVSGLGTNHWSIGREECAKRIVEMVRQGKKEAGIPAQEPLACLSLCLSGCTDAPSNKLLEDEIKRVCPDASSVYVLNEDTVGSIATATDKGAIVVISGTGSNAILRNPDGTLHTCGGFGHLLGDRGGAYWISNLAVQTIFDHVDGYELSPYDTATVWDDIKRHFRIETRLDLLDHFYGRFDKSKIAGLCAKLSQSADGGDALCQYFFREAGKALARHVCALLPKASEDLLSRNTKIAGGDDGKDALKIICVGSVWNSWRHLRAGFVEVLDKHGGGVDALNLVKLTEKGSLGALYLAADALGFPIKKCYEQNYESFFVYRRNDRQ